MAIMRIVGVDQETWNSALNGSEPSLRDLYDRATAIERVIEKRMDSTVDQFRYAQLSQTIETEAAAMSQSDPGLVICEFDDRSTRLGLELLHDLNKLTHGSSHYINAVVPKPNNFSRTVFSCDALSEHMEMLDECVEKHQMSKTSFSKSEDLLIENDFLSEYRKGFLVARRSNKAVILSIV